MNQNFSRGIQMLFPKVKFPTPNPTEDRGCYERVSESLQGVVEMLERYRRNEGAVGYASLNVAMACSKASVAYDVRREEGDVEEAAEYRSDMGNIVTQFQTTMLPDELSDLLGTGLGHAVAQVGRNPKLDMIHQEHVEAKLFALFYQVITSSDLDVVIPTLPTLKDFGCPVQAVIAGYQDLPLELATRLDEFMVNNYPGINSSEHVFYYDRFIAIIRSIYQKLEEFNGVPGYVINNSFWRGSAFGSKQFRIKMLLIRQTGSQEQRLFQKKIAKEMLRDLTPSLNSLR